MRRIMALSRWAVGEVEPLVHEHEAIGNRGTLASRLGRSGRHLKSCVALRVVKLLRASLPPVPFLQQALGTVKFTTPTLSHC